MKSAKNNKTGKSLSIYLRTETSRLLSSRLVPRNASAAIDAAIGRYMTICDRHRPSLSHIEMIAVMEAIPVDTSGIAVGTVPWSAVDDANAAGRLDHLGVDAGSLSRGLN